MYRLLIGLLLGLFMSSCVSKSLYKQRLSELDAAKTSVADCVKNSQQAQTVIQSLKNDYESLKAQYLILKAQADQLKTQWESLGK